MSAIALAPPTPPSADAPSRPGDLLAPGYTVVGLLRRGRDLDVYEVWSADRATPCVAKVCRPDRGDPRVRRRLLREGRLLRRLSHPHLVRAYEVFELPRATVILEPLTGETLERLIERQGRLAADDVVHLGQHLCAAMHYLHNQGVLHLDLKPSNIVAQSDLAKVLDLSIARPPGRGRRGVGTRQYMAPEQARGRFLTPATDVWGIGVVLFEAATGQRAFPESEAECFHPQLARRAAPLRTLRPCVPRALASAVDAALEPDPDRRLPLAELARTLDELGR